MDESLRALTAKFHRCERVAREAVSRARKALIKRSTVDPDLIRAQISAGFWTIYRDALGINHGLEGLLPSLDPDLDLAAATIDAENAARAWSTRKLTARDRTAAGAALREIMRLHGVQAPERTEHSFTGGVLLAPQPLSATAWQDQALSPPVDSGEDLRLLGELTERSEAFDGNSDEGW